MALLEDVEYPVNHVLWNADACIAHTKFSIRKKLAAPSACISTKRRFSAPEPDRVLLHGKRAIARRAPKWTKIAHLMQRRHGGRRARVRGCVRVTHGFALFGRRSQLQGLARSACTYDGCTWNDGGPSRGPSNGPGNAASPPTPDSSLPATKPPLAARRITRSPVRHQPP